MAVSPGLHIAWPLATVRTRSSLHAFESVALHCWKPTPTSSTPPQTHCLPFVKRSRIQSNTGCGNAPGSMRLDRTSLEVLLHPSRSFPTTLGKAFSAEASTTTTAIAYFIAKLFCATIDRRGLAVRGFFLPMIPGLSSRDTVASLPIPFFWIYVRIFVNPWVYYSSFVTSHCVVHCQPSSKHSGVLNCKMNYDCCNYFKKNTLFE